MTNDWDSTNRYITPIHNIEREPDMEPSGDKICRHCGNWACVEGCPGMKDDPTAESLHTMQASLEAMKMDIADAMHHLANGAMSLRELIENAEAAFEAGIPKTGNALMKSARKELDRICGAIDLLRTVR